MIEKQKLMSNGLTSQFLAEISRATGQLHASLFCRTCGDGLVLELADGELAIGCFGCQKHITLRDLVKAAKESNPKII